ncbi:aminoglycoside phosphotransferase, partial [gut metagenome]
KLADLYLELFCKKSDTAKQYVQKWLPIAAAVALTKGEEDKKEFLMKWIDIIDFQ